MGFVVAGLFAAHEFYAEPSIEPREEHVAFQEQKFGAEKQLYYPRTRSTKIDFESCYESANFQRRTQ